VNTKASCAQQNGNKCSLPPLGNSCGGGGGVFIGVVRGGRGGNNVRTTP
jgi:hypothetical protein